MLQPIPRSRASASRTAQHRWFSRVLRGRCWLLALWLSLVPLELRVRLVLRALLARLVRVVLAARVIRALRVRPARQVRPGVAVPAQLGRRVLPATLARRGRQAPATPGLRAELAALGLRARQERPVLVETRPLSLSAAWGRRRRWRLRAHR